ncbi:MAG: hypothetical protein AAFQ37_09685, partial [Bacteroidota bacterium]
MKVPKAGVENKFENGRLVVQVTGLSTELDGYLKVGGGFGMVGNRFTFNLTSNVEVPGLASGELMLALDDKNELNGKATIEADIANVKATVIAEYLAGVVTIQGTGQIESEKFSGSITLLVTDKARSKQMMHAALGVESMEGEKEQAEGKPKPKTPKNQVLVGWGEVTAKVTSWLEGTVKVGIDADGHITMVGELVVPDEVELMEQRGKKIDLFEVEIRAGYGIPLVGQVFLFASIGMFVNAGFGPLVLRDVRLEGTYSTDPKILQNFKIGGTLAINAFAVVGLQAEAGVGLTLIGHDLKAGISVTAAAGLRAYALANALLEYSESQAPEGGKVGEARIKGHFEAAAQLFLQLAGSLFYEIDSPWWSPAPDGRTDHPLGEVQYPIGDSMGIGADLDYLIGSPEIPELTFSPVEFDPEQFTADVMADPPPGKKGNSEEKPEGDWQDGSPKGEGDSDPKVEKGGEGIPGSDKKKEDLKKLPDDQKYMRGLDEISKIAKSREKPTEAVVESKVNKIKSKYGLNKVSLKDRQDGSVKVFVKHASRDNSNNLVEIPVMSEAERAKLLLAAMTDLDKKVAQAAGEAGTLSKGQAESVADSWHKAHPVIESARVVDGGDSWDFQVDIGDKDKRVPGKGKADAQTGKQEPDTEGLEDWTKYRKPFNAKDGSSHELYFVGD